VRTDIQHVEINDRRGCQYTVVDTVVQSRHVVRVYMQHAEIVTAEEGSIHCY